jgi:hypothetical protein
VGIKPIRLVVCVIAVAVVAAGCLPVSPVPVPAPPGQTPAGQFVETFDGNQGLDRFDFGIYHRDDFLVDMTTWTGDHDMNCGLPDTQRLIHRDVPGESFYMCRDHLMTAIGDTSGYSTGWFSPKQPLVNVKRVSWDVSVTDLLARKWWEVSVVPASFYSGVPSCPQCSVIDFLASPGGASGLPQYPPNSVVVGNGPYGGEFHVFANGQDSDPAGWQRVCGVGALDPDGCASKSIRRTFVLADNGNGTLTLTAFGNTYTFSGSFPTGAVKVVFKDHNYVPNKDGVPVGYTWHWDNIIIE